MSSKVKLGGTVSYDCAVQNWSASGVNWHLSGVIGPKVRVLFCEPLACGMSGDLAPSDYAITATSLGDAPEGVRLLVSGFGPDGFDLAWTNTDPEGGILKASFDVDGIKADPVPDDRDLTADESLADVHAARMVYQYEAKYGTVSVMCSASIESEAAVRSVILKLNGIADAARDEIDAGTDPGRLAQLRERLRDASTKLARQERILKNSVRFWESARRFGELWGEYSAREQEAALGGKYVPLLTGGGPGLMRAAALGGRCQNAQVLGIDSKFGNDEFHDLKGDYTLPSNVRLRMNDFAIREAMLLNNSNVVCFFPGGYGTGWEVCEVLSKIQTRRLRKRRLKAIFVHLDFWTPFFKMVDGWREYGTVNAWGDRIKIPRVDDQAPDAAYCAEAVDTAEEAFALAKAFVEGLHARNELQLGADDQ